MTPTTTIEGTIRLVEQVETAGSGFQWRYALIETVNEKYPKTYRVKLVKEDVNLLSPTDQGHSFRLECYVGSWERNGYYNTDLTVRKADRVGAAQQAPEDQTPEPQEQTGPDGLPF